MSASKAPFSATHSHRSLLTHLGRLVHDDEVPSEQERGADENAGRVQHERPRHKLKIMAVFEAWLILIINHEN